MFKYKRWIRAALLLPLLMIYGDVGTANAQSSANYKMRKDVLDESGLPSNSLSYRLDDATGQPSAIGKSASANYVLSAGFFAAPAAVVTPMATVILPAGATGASGATVNIPVKVSTDSTIGVAQFVIDYNSGVLTFQSVQPGADAPAFSAIANPNLAFPPSTPGTDKNVSVQVSSGTKSFTGAGQEVAILTFSVVGTAGQTSPLAFDQDPVRTSLTTTNFSDINNGKLIFQDGLFTVTTGFTVSGTVSYYNGARPVSATQIVLAAGGSNQTASTNNSGAYIFTGQTGGAITLTPAKTGNVNKITGSDALLILRYLAFLETLTAEQKKAADVTQDGAVSGADALAILRYLAFFTTNIGSTGSWVFNPPNISAILNASLTGQNFTAYLLGDITGDWGTSAVAAGRDVQNKLSMKLTKRELEETPAGGLALGEVPGPPGENFTVPLTLTGGGKAVYTATFSLDYDSELLRYLRTQLTPLAANYLFVVNANEKGKLHVALAGVKGIKPGGEVLSFVFEAVDTRSLEESSELVLSLATINDRPVSQLTHGRILFNASEAASSVPEVFELSQNYPNPFNPTTTINIAVPGKFSGGVRVNLDIFNLRGQVVRNLIKKTESPGIHSVVWDSNDDHGRPAPAGLYFYTVSLGEFKATRKMILLK